jgi:hypothetical protein
MATEDNRIKLPEGRLINHSLFELDTYESPNGKKGDPRYTIEMVFPKAATKEGGELDDFMNAIMDGADAKWGKKEWVLSTDSPKDFNLNVALKDGDKYAAKREEAGKKGDAYKGMWILRAHTIFDKNGARFGTNGAQVYDASGDTVDEIGKTLGNTGRIWQGCYGQLVVTLNFYEDDDGDKCVSYYMAAFARTGGDEKKDRLASSADLSGAFKPVGRKTSGGEGPGEGSGRRSRKG